MNTLIDRKISRLEEWNASRPNKLIGPGFVELLLPSDEHGVVPIVNNQSGFNGPATYDYDKSPFTIPRGLRRVQNPLGGTISDYSKTGMPLLVPNSKERISSNLIWGITNKRAFATEAEIAEATTNEMVHICDVFEKEEDYKKCGGAACSTPIFVEGEDTPIVFQFEIPEEAHDKIDYSCRKVNTRNPRDVINREGKDWFETFLIPTYDGVLQGLVWIPILCSKDPIENKALLTEVSASKLNVVGYEGGTFHNDDCPMSIILYAKLLKRPAPCPPPPNN